MENEKVTKLIILGNGFDLKLGLESKFEDYMKDFYIDEKKEEKKEKELKEKELKELKKLDNSFSKLGELVDCTLENMKTYGAKLDDINDTVNEIKDLKKSIFNIEHNEKNC